jgi:hypothetical protein
MTMIISVSSSCSLFMFVVANQSGCFPNLGAVSVASLAVVMDKDWGEQPAANIVLSALPAEL